MAVLKLRAEFRDVFRGPTTPKPKCIMVQARKTAVKRPGLHKPEDCQPLSQILVRALEPGTKLARLKCISNADFLVYCSTNFFSTGGAPPGWGYSVQVNSTGAGIGSTSPIFIVGGVANDVITITMTPGTSGFITLQTRCDAKAQITAA